MAMQLMGEVSPLKQYDVLNKCLKILKDSDVDIMNKLRMENLILQMKMFLLLDIHKQEAMPEIFGLRLFEELLSHVKEVCSAGAAEDGVEGLVEHVRRMYTVMAEYLNRNG